MKSPNYKVKIGIVGCGAIGARMAHAIATDLSKDCQISGLYDNTAGKAKKLKNKLKLPKRVTTESLNSVISNCDCMIEAVNADETHSFIKKALNAQKSVLAMSVGKLLNTPDLFRLAKQKKSYILLPSGAIAGVDAIKAASLAGIKKITLTTYKPPAGLAGSPYLTKQNIDLSKIKKETLIFEGSVNDAVRNFPRNINVAATIALASDVHSKFNVRIITAPHYKTNTHEIEMIGEFGRMVTRTENVVCPDNPKSSYLAVLSGLQTLKQYCTGILIGT